MLLVFSFLFAAQVHAQSFSDHPRLEVLGPSNVNFTAPGKHTFIFENVGIRPITQVQPVPMVAPFHIDDLDNPTMTSCSGTLPAGGRCTMTVVYQPTDNSNAAGTLILSYYDGQSWLAAFATLASGQ